MGPRQREAQRRDSTPVSPFQHHSAQRGAHPELAGRPHPVCRGSQRWVCRQASSKPFPRGDPRVAMGFWTEKDLPFYASLARTFALADRWHCSLLGPTFPESTIPHSRDLQRAHRRRAGRNVRLSPVRHDLRPPGPVRDHLGELPSCGRVESGVQASVGQPRLEGSAAVPPRARAASSPKPSKSAPAICSSQRTCTRLAYGGAVGTFGISSSFS